MPLGPQGSCCRCRTCFRHPVQRTTRRPVNLTRVAPPRRHAHHTIGLNACSWSAPRLSPALVNLCCSSGPFLRMQDAENAKGRVVALLPPAPLPTTWDGSFQRQLPLSGQSLLRRLTSCQHGWPVCSRWMPPLTLAPPPGVITLQLAARPPSTTPPLSEARARSLKRLNAGLARGGPVPWPLEWRACLSVRMPPLVLVVCAAMATEKRVTSDVLPHACDAEHCVICSTQQMAQALAAEHAEQIGESEGARSPREGCTEGVPSRVQDGE